MNYYIPKEIIGIALRAVVNKVQLNISQMVILGMLAGVYIGFGAEASTMAMHDIGSVGAGRFLAGVIFATGLMLVILCGGELFTGNMLIWLGYLEHKVSMRLMLKNWFYVYIGNLIGALLLAWMMNISGLWSYNNGLYGDYVVKIALSKLNLSFSEALVRGILCNWLVCLAVWMAYAAKDIPGKIMSIFFPIMLFVTSSFEHSVANMYYLAAGILAGNDQTLLVLSGLAGKTANLNVTNALVNNLLPVTLGNIIGGVVFVASCYWYCYKNDITKAP